MSDENQQMTATSKANGKTFVLVLMTFVILGLGGAFAYGYYTLKETNTELARSIAEMRDQTMTNQQSLQSMQQSLADLTKVAAEQSKEPEHQSNNIWQVAEANYLTRLANHYLVINKDPATAITLLQHAAALIQLSDNAELQAIRQSLTDNLNTLTAQKNIDVEQLYTELNNLNQQLDQLPLPLTPLQAATDNAPSAASDVSWWQTQWNKGLESLRKIVLVKRMGQNELPLVLPEEKIFLYQNLHAQIQAAMLGALQHNTSIYQSSLQQAQHWIQQYFLQTAPITQETLKKLADLQSVNLQVPNANLPATIQLFDQYLAANWSKN